MSNTITIHQRDEHVYDGMASAAVTPGELVELSGFDGDTPTYAPHSGAGAGGGAFFAKEYSHTGMSVDDEYSAGDHMELRKGLTGERYYAFLSVGETVGEGDLLLSDGAGALEEPAAGEEASAICQAYETVDNETGTDPVRIIVEVL